MKFSICISFLTLFFLVSCGSSEESPPKDQMDETQKVKRYICESGETVINFVVSEPATKDIFGKAPPDSAICGLNYSGPNKKGSYHGGSSNDCENELLKLMDQYKSQNYACHVNNSTTQTTEPEKRKYICKDGEIKIDVILSKPAESAACSVNYSGAGADSGGSFSSANISNCENKLQEVMDEFSTQGYICHLNDNSIKAALSELQGQINTFSKFGPHRDIIKELQKQLDDLSQRSTNGMVLVSCYCWEEKKGRVDPRQIKPADPRVRLRAGGVSRSEAIENVTISCKKHYQRVYATRTFITDCETRTFSSEEN